MRTITILCGLPLLALAACHADVDVSDVGNSQSGDNVHVAMKDDGKGGSAVSVKVPGFNADVSLPQIDLGGHVDLDGITLAPKTKVGGIDVNAHDTGPGDKNGEGKVQLSFTNPDAPAALIDHYARSALDAGYGAIARTGSSLTAQKAEKNFALEVVPDGSGSRGTITISGKDTN
jgi:hypothetical protein